MDTEQFFKKKDSVNIKYKNFKESHDINEKICCEICGGSYTYFNKSTHKKTKKHIMEINKMELEKNKIELDKIRNIVNGMNILKN
jgi:hypothetical protein